MAKNNQTADSDVENLFEDLTSERFKIDKKEVSNILKKEIRIDSVLKAKIEACVKEKCRRELTIFEHTSYIAPKGIGQEITFANQFFALLARCYDYAKALYKYISFFDSKVKSAIEEDPNAFDTKELAEKECGLRIARLIPTLSITDSDKEYLKNFLCNKEFRLGAKEIINYSEIKAKTNKGKIKIDCRDDVLGSCILKIIPIPDTSSQGFMEILAKAIVQDMALYEQLKDALLENANKRIVLRDANKIGFFREVLKKTMELDPNLSKLNWEIPQGKNPVTLKIGDLLAGRRIDSPTRTGNGDLSIQWSFKDVSYCVNNELYPDDIKKIFPIYNETYKGHFYLDEDPRNDEFVMYAFAPSKSTTSNFLQQIFYGAPGTGKSHKIDHCLFKENGESFGLKELNNLVFRTTFHPDYDYAQFVGAYKPIVKSNLDCQNETEAEGKSSKKQDEISYSFVPQVFSKAYAAAWKNYLGGNKEDVFFVIEEINRGNCAQIFGDIFQLLDRIDEGEDKGFSQYSIDSDSDFAEWLEKYSVLNEKYVWKAYEEQAGKGKLRLPPNFNILATMNTSDQSLFPMDSAFKRRFDWEYVPIRYKAPKNENGEKIDKNWDADKFKISFKYKDKEEEVKDCFFYWIKFLKKINADIYRVTECEDKQMGEFFIKPKNEEKAISLEEFRSKVLFYLWDTVYKDETDKNAIFHFKYPNDNGSVVTFQRLFEDDFGNILLKILERLDEAYNGDEFKDFKILEK